MIQAAFSTVIGFLLLISAVILIHEGGHFLVARRMGIRVLAFSMGFGPVLWRYTAKDGVEYRLSLVPFGGYVRMAGEDFSDERKGTPDEFLSAPIRRRVAIIIAGPAMNLILGWTLCVGIHLRGLEAPAAIARMARVLPGTPAAAAGLRDGDRVLSVDGSPVAFWNDFADVVAANEGKPLRLEVERDTAVLSLSLVPSRRPLRDGPAIARAYEGLRAALRGGGYAGAVAWLDPVVGTVEEGSPAAAAGIRPGDRIVAVGDTAVARWEEAATVIHRSPEETVAITLAGAGGGRRVVSVVPRLAVQPTPDGFLKFGAIGIDPVTRPDPRPLGEALLDGTVMTVGMGNLVVWTIEKLFSGSLSPKLLAGPVGIAQMAGQKFRRGLAEYVLLTALISVNLALVNMVPFPVLDGGWLFIFFPYEAVMKRPMPQKVQNAVWGAAIFSLLALILFITYNDVVRWIGLQDVRDLIEQTK